jgi:hypothetical protein
MVCDVMTDPNFRGRGIFTTLGRYATCQMRAAGLDCLTGFPIRLEVLPGHLKVGWSVAFDLPMFLRPLRASAILKSKGMAFLAPLAHPVLRGLNALLSVGTVNRDYSTRVHSGSSLFEQSRIQTFLKDFAAVVPNYMEKNADFYRWRLGAPSHQYSVIEVERQGKCGGLAVTRRAILHGIPVVAVLDMMVLPSFSEGLAALHSALVSLAEVSAAEALVTMMSKQSAARYRLRRYFYLKSPFVFKLILKPLSSFPDQECLFNPRNWHLMWIDSDDL